MMENLEIHGELVRDSWNGYFQGPRLVGQKTYSSGIFYSSNLQMNKTVLVRNEIHHTYTIILTQEPLNRPLDLENLPTPHSDLLSQLSCTTSCKTSPSPISIPSTEAESDNQYISLAMTSDRPKVVSSDFSKKREEVKNPQQSCTEINGYSYLNPVSNPTGKFLNMVHVKFILLHQDSCKRRVQSTFSDEFQSDTPLEDVVLNFQQLCARQLRGQEFRPRLSYCVGESNKKNSKPVTKGDLGKSLAQLESSNNTVFEFSLIADNNSE